MPHPTPTPTTLEALIYSAGLSQLEAARILGVDGRSVRRWLAGSPPPPYWACRLLALETEQVWPHGGPG